MTDEDVLELLNKQITAMQVIQQEFTHIYVVCTDLDDSDEIRSNLTDINQQLFVLQTQANQLRDATAVVSAPTQGEVDDIEKGLNQLDAYVRNDANFHMAINYLMQVAALVGSK